MLEVRNLSKNFGPIRAVRDVSFTVEKGEVLGFLGPNGAGKTTTMRMITGFLPPSSGTAIIAGHDIVEKPVAAKKQLGYLPENAPVYSDMTVWNYLNFIAEIRGFSGQRRKEIVGETIEKCRLDQVARQGIETLSKGFNQRVCLAQALLHDPPMLILDEPTDGLDPNQKHVVRSMIREMAADKVIVISTHILEEVDAVCTRAVIIKGGAIAANGSPTELKARSKMHGAVELTMKEPAPDLKIKLQSLNEAERVEVAGNRCLILPRKKEELLDAVLEAIRANPSWRIASLKVVEGRLDEVFRELTTGANE